MNTLTPTHAAVSNYHNSPPARKPAAQSRILVVEDDKSLRELYSEVLSLAGFQVETAEDGQHGLKALQISSYDLVITDNNMPRLTGMEMVRQIRDGGTNVPVILASSSPLTKGEFKSLRLTNFIAKPFPLSLLIDSVHTALKQ